LLLFERDRTGLARSERDRRPEERSGDSREVTLRRLRSNVSSEPPRRSRRSPQTQATTPARHPIEERADRNHCVDSSGWTSGWQRPERLFTARGTRAGTNTVCLGSHVDATSLVTPWTDRVLPALVPGARPPSWFGPRLLRTRMIPDQCHHRGMLDTSRAHPSGGLPSSEPLPKRSARSSTLDSASRENGCGPSCQGPACPRVRRPLRQARTGLARDNPNVVSARPAAAAPLLVPWLRVSVFYWRLVLAIWLPPLPLARKISRASSGHRETSHPAYGTTRSSWWMAITRSWASTPSQAANQHVTIDLPNAFRRISRWSSTTRSDCCPGARRARYRLRAPARMGELPAANERHQPVRADGRSSCQALTAPLRASDPTCGREFFHLSE